MTEYNGYFHSFFILNLVFFEERELKLLKVLSLILVFLPNMIVKSTLHGEADTAVGTGKTLSMNLTTKTKGKKLFIWPN